jgi:retron-type reverse transcriptase
MKTVKNIFGQICDFNNVEGAYWRASSCKHTYPEFMRFEKNRYSNLVNIMDEVQDMTYKVGDYSYFVVFEPKRREIMKLPAKDRIVQHMWYSIVNPIIDTKLYDHTYACRRNYGLHKCSETLHSWIYKECIINGKKMWAIKGDIKSYFKTIDHNILKNQIMRFIGDNKALDLTFKFIDSNGNLPNGVGIPVGNLTSQLFANIYGNILDEFVKHELRCEYYARYMDDFAIALDDYHSLESILIEIAQFMFENMRMTLNPKTTIVYINNNGLDFIGFRHFPEYTIPRKSSYKRLCRFTDLYINGYVSQEDFHKSFPSRTGHLIHADSYQFIARLQNEINEAFIDENIDVLQSLHKDSNNSQPKVSRRNMPYKNEFLYNAPSSTDIKIVSPVIFT